MSLVFWDKQTDIILADGTPCTPEVAIQKWPFAARDKVILELAGDHVMAFESLSILESNYQIDPDMSDNEKLVEIEKARYRMQDPNYDEIEEIIADLEADLEG